MIRKPCYGNFHGMMVPLRSRSQKKHIKVWDSRAQTLSRLVTNRQAPARSRALQPSFLSCQVRKPKKFELSLFCKSLCIIQKCKVYEIYKLETKNVQSLRTCTNSVTKLPIRIRLVSKTTSRSELPSWVPSTMIRNWLFVKRYV